MAEQDNRRFGGESHAGRPSASRNASKGKRDTISESVSSGTRSGSRGRPDKLSLDVHAPSPRTRKRTREQSLGQAESSSETKKKKVVKKSRGCEASSSSEAHRVKGQTDSATPASTSQNTRRQRASVPSTRSRSRSEKSSERKGSQRSTRSSTASAGPSSSSGIAVPKTQSSRKSLPTTSAPRKKKIETNQSKPEDGARRGQKKRKVEGSEETYSCAKATKSEAQTSAAAGQQPVAQDNQGDQEEEKGRYPLRRQVRVDQSGVIIPLFPPSPVEIALAQGRRPTTPRRSSATWTLTSPTREDKPGDKSKPGESSSSGAGVVQLRVTLRRSTRASNNTGSCVSSRRSSRAGKVGSVGSWTMSGAAGAGQAGGSGASASQAGPAGPATDAASASSPALLAPTTESTAGAAPRAPPVPGRSQARDDNFIRADDLDDIISYADSSQSPSLSSFASALTSVSSSSPVSINASFNSDDSFPTFASSWTSISSGSSASAMVRELYELTSESDDNNDVGRLQALLESRGLPPHLFGALGPRMQHILNRSITVSSTSKAQQLLSGLQATGDESQQLQAVMEMCQMLIMGNEDTLTGFPVKDVVPALITLLTMDHNFVMMNHACRALTYMMEALPRSSTIVVDAVPVFLEKLQEIQCMDVAEQSLTALETLSRRHSKSILMARGVAACLKFLDFFSITAQRAALAITANCCQNVHHMELTYVTDSLPVLASRLTRQSDKKCVESICLSFCRLVDSFQNDPVKLQEIASPQLLTNLQQLLVEAPPVISTSTFISVLRMLTTMCSACPNLAQDLLKQNMAETLCYLLTGTAHCNNQNEQVELVSRGPQELYELTCLIGELMPRLPTDGIFSVDGLVERGQVVATDTVQWQWRDEHGRWHPYSLSDSRLIEIACVNHVPEVSLHARYSPTVVNLTTLTQVCEEVGTSHPVRRRVNSVTPTSASSDTQTDTDVTTNDNFSNDGNSLNKMEGESEESTLASEFVRALFSTLYEVYSSSAGPAVRYKCLKALLRMVYFSSPDLLKEVLKKEMVASHIAGMLASHDLRIVVGALQMANILMQKLPDIFGVRFLREGVTHELKQLSTAEPTPETPGTPVTSCSGPSATLTPSNGSLLQPNTPPPPPLIPSPELTHAQLKLTDVLSRKRKPKRNYAVMSTGGRSRSKQEEPTVSVTDILSVKSSSSSGLVPRSRISGASAKTSSFLANLNPARWGRSAPLAADSARNFFKDSVLSCSPSNSTLTAGNKEKVRSWVRDTSTKMIDVYFSRTVNTADVLSQLTGLIANMHSEDLQNGGLNALEELRDILRQSDISPFEVNHSGLVQALLQYLTDENNRDHRLRVFLHVFGNLPVDANGAVNDLNTHSLSLLVSKLNNCLSQLEQLPVKVHDLPAGARGGTSALKFFNTHQLKCNLQRHPDCTNLKQWKGGSVKIDPLALVQAIERYLVVRGYGRVRGHDTAESDDDNSEDDDIDDTLAAVVLSQGSSRHQLQFLIGDNVLPYNMTVYQAVRQFASAHTDASETDTDNETPLGHSALWVQTHTIMYRAAPAVLGPPSTPSCRKHKGTQAKSHRKPDLLWTEGTVPAMVSPLSPYLTPKLPECVTITDASLEVLALLRVVHAINRYWGCLYRVTQYQPLLPFSAFINPKIAAKASRQLQDPLVIMTGNLPLWLQQIALACPFLLPFETRQLLFYATSFDRDRALQRLLDTTPDLTSTDSSERVTPKLERRKRTISRNDILKQAESVIQDLGSSRALLEVQYENEVGTGLGPTLEFYALVSRELQRSDLSLWSGEVTQADGISYTYTPTGLFPSPLGHSGKLAHPGKLAHAHLTKLKSKFRFLGRLMAKAVMDSRLLDISFSPVLFRWLLGQEGSFSLADLQHVAPDVHRTLSFLLTNKLSPEDSCLDFTLPGHSDIELKKGGADISVTDENVEQYIQLVVHWRLVEGVSRQMEALKEGFEAVFPLQQLHIFYPEELDSVFCGSQQRTGWDMKTLSECFRPDHGYSMDSRAIRFLLEVLTNYTAEEQRLFLQFVTGSPRLPVGGFKSLSPALTIVRKDVEGEACADTYLPSVMTCVNYLKLPDYSTVEVMKARLETACREGSHSFHLS